MHQTKKGNQWYYGMKDPIGVDAESGLIHSVETTAANVHDLTPAAELLHGEEKVVDADAGYQGNAKRPEMEGKKILFRVAMRPGQRRVLPDTAEGREAKAEGHGEKPLQGACVGSAHESVFGSHSSTPMHTGIGMVCLLGLIRGKKVRESGAIRRQ
jgi:IS5 family transposase